MKGEVLLQANMEELNATSLVVLISLIIRIYKLVILVNEDRL